MLITFTDQVFLKYVKKQVPAYIGTPGLMFTKYEADRLCQNITYITTKSQWMGDGIKSSCGGATGSSQYTFLENIIKLDTLFVIIWS